MDLFSNAMQKYVPPQRYLTSAFGKDILCGKKKLLNKAEIIWVDNLPNWSEFSTKRIWLSCKNRSEWSKIKLYFPDFTGDTLPNKQYLVNVLNTIIPNCIMDTIQAIRKQKIAVEEVESPIILIDEYFQALKGFTSIATNQRISGIHRLVHQDELVCMICKENITRSSKKQFKCKRHVGHRGCVNQFNNSAMGRAG